MSRQPGADVVFKVYDRFEEGGMNNPITYMGLTVMIWPFIRSSSRKNTDKNYGLCFIIGLAIFVFGLRMTE